MTHFFFQADQRQKTPVTTQIGSQISCRYAFDRSADSIKAGEPGQDYLTILAEDDKLVFVLCDGVSQSFFGDLAARLLGDSLADWLWKHAQESIQGDVGYGGALELFLAQLSQAASSEISTYPLPGGIPAMLQVVLEKKRVIGSETMFAAGYLDLTTETFFLSWMGDIRLRLWNANTEQTAELLGSENFQTRERWSSKRGLLGTLHSAHIPARDVTRIMAYSDGLARLDRQIRQGSPSNATLERLLEESKLLPTSDDISLAEIWIRQKPRWDRSSKHKAPSQVKTSVDAHTAQLLVAWAPTVQASSYDLALISDRYWQIISTCEPNWSGKLDALPPRVASVSVRAWCDEEASPWSRAMPVMLPGAKTDSIAEPIHLPDPPVLPKRMLIKRYRLRFILLALIFFGLILAASIYWIKYRQSAISPGRGNVTQPTSVKATIDWFEVNTLTMESGWLSTGGASVDPR